MSHERYGSLAHVVASGRREPPPPSIQSQLPELSGGLRSQAAQLRLAKSPAPSTFPFAMEPTNLMKPSQSKPQGLLEKDSSTTLFHSSRLHHFHFTAFQWEIIKQNYKHNEERKKKAKKKKKPLGESCILCVVKGLVTLFIGGSRHYLASLAGRSAAQDVPPAAEDNRLQ